MTSSSIPHTRAAVWPELRSGGLVERLRRDSPQDCGCALLGLPDDLGVRLNRGRSGAAHGPAAFRAALARVGTPWDGLREAALSCNFFDAGDVEPAPGNTEQTLFETHARVEQAARALHRMGLVVIAVGGGHDLALPTLRAYATHERRALGGINLDAHTDVRATVGSGMPFRWLIEAGALDPSRFVELGLGRFSNSESDLGWLRHRGARLIHADQIWDQKFDAQRLLASTQADFATIDLDGLDQSVAPGVSAPAASGLSVRHGVALAEAAGRCHTLRHFDLMELCPPHDESDRTARVAALLATSFLAGLSDRQARSETATDHSTEQHL